MRNDKIKRKFDDVEIRIKKAFSSVKEEISELQKSTSQIEALKNNGLALDKKKLNEADFRQHEKSMRASFKDVTSDLSKLDKLRKDVENKILRIDARQKELDDSVEQVVKELKRINSLLKNGEEIEVLKQDISGLYKKAKAMESENEKISKRLRHFEKKMT